MPAFHDHITWPETYAIGQAVDALAVTMGTPIYERLQDLMDAPFYYSDKQDAEFTIEFGLVEPSGHSEAFDPDYAPEVKYQKLMTGTGNLAVPLVLPPHLGGLVEGDNLFFLHDKDDCLCKTMFKVKRIYDEFGELTTEVALEEVFSPAVTCGCQTLTVPQRFYKLDFGQHIIPAAYAHDWGVIGFGPGDESPLWRFPHYACEDGPLLLYYEFIQFADVSEDTYAYMSKAQREMTGKWIWPIRGYWYDLIMSKLSEIVDCSNNCGAKEGTVLAAESTDTYIKENCPVSLCDILWTMKQNGASTAMGNILDCYSWPWGSGENLCEANGPKVYALTLNQITDLIAKIPDCVKVYSSTCDCCDSGGDPAPYLECVSAQASPCGIAKPETSPVEYYSKVVSRYLDVAHTGLWVDETTTYYVDGGGVCRTTVNKLCLPYTITVNEESDPDTEPQDYTETYSEVGYFASEPPHKYVHGFTVTYTFTGTFIYTKTTVTKYGIPTDAIESETEPLDPAVDAVWHKTSTGEYFRFKNGEWVTCDPCEGITTCEGHYNASSHTTTSIVYVEGPPGWPKPDDFNSTSDYSIAGDWEWIEYTPAVPATETEDEIPAVEAHCQFSGTLTSAGTNSYDPEQDSSITRPWEESDGFLYPVWCTTVTDASGTFCDETFTASTITTTTEDPDLGADPAPYVATTTYLVPVTLTFPDFPPWPEDRPPGFTYATGQSDLCTATVLRKVKWRIRHYDDGSCYLKVWVRVYKEPDYADEEDSYEDDIYTWNSSRSTCRGEATGYVHSLEHTIPNTGTGIEYPEVLKWSCETDYTPDISDPDNPQPNCRPDPDWEPEPP